MVTVAAHDLIRRTIKEEEGDPRMPPTWLTDTTWQTFPEPKQPRAPRKG